MTSHSACVTGGRSIHMDRWRFFRRARHAEAESLVEEHGQLARRRRDRLGLADARGQASVERAEGGLGPAKVYGRNSEEGRRPIGRAADRSVEYSTAGNLVG